VFAMSDSSRSVLGDSISYEFDARTLTTRL
jgi:hypothetical protein